MIDTIVVGKGNARIAVPLVRDRTQRHLAAALVSKHLGLVHGASK